MSKKPKHPMTHELLRLMKKHGLSQSAIARKSGVARNTVHYWLKEKPVIPEGRLRLLKFELETLAA